MMPAMLLQRIQQHFIDSADLQYQCAQAVAPAVEAAVGAVLAAITGGGKVLAGGHGLSVTQAQAFAAALLGRFERDRPELAACVLGANVAAVTGIAHHYEAAATLARQVRALGQAGDVLLLLTTQGPTSEIAGAVQAAHERDMVVVLLCGARAASLQALLTDTDVLISVPSERLARVWEAHQVALHCICDGIDAQLLGDDPTLEQNE